MSLIHVQAAPLPDDYDGFLETHDPEYSDYIASLRRPAGSFNTDTAMYWDCSGNGNDRLWLTPSGKWVITSKFYGKAYVTRDWARRWLAGNGWSEVVITHIDVEHEGRGRPEIGPELKVRVPEQVRDAVDKLAATNSHSRSEQLRIIIMDTVPL